MRRFRHRWRRRRAALGLLAAATAITVFAGPITSGAEAGDAPRFKANKKKVRTGAKVKVSGQFDARSPQGSGTLAPGAARRPPASVAIQFKPAGKSSYRAAGQTKTRKDGSYSHRVKVRRSGLLRAVAPDGRVSQTDRVRAKSHVTARIGRKHLKRGQKLKVKGKVLPAIGKRKVVVKVGSSRLKTRINKRGRFSVRWKAAGTGARKVTVKARGDKVAAGSRDRAGRAIVYRPAQASFYGPGLYGNGTACGRRLKPSTMGVAHKTLPCGTKVRIRYGNKTVRVPVIDRGPYAGNREWDITEAVRNKLGFPGVATVWTDK